METLFKSPLEEAKFYHKETGHEFFVLSNGAVWAWHWFNGNQCALDDIVYSSGDGSSLEPLLTKIENQKNK